MMSRDLLSAGGLTRSELSARTLQVQEERYRARSNPTKLESINHNFMMGTAEERGDACAAPGQHQYVLAELARERAVQRELRKAREGRQLAPGPVGVDGRGDGRKGKKGNNDKDGDARAPGGGSGPGLRP